MLWRTHVTLGAGLGALAGTVLHPGDPMAAASFAGIGGAASLLPDLDSPHSKLGRAARPLSDILNFALGHRGFLHSLLGMSLILILAALIALFWLPPSTALVLLLPAALGYLSHLLLDALTPGGVPLLWPRSGKASLPLLKTGGLFERMVFLPVMAAVVVIIFLGVMR